MKAFLIIDTEDKREKVEVTNKQIKTLTPIIKNINSGFESNHSTEEYELFAQICPFDEKDVTSINIVYHN
jgi:hypothetical protein